MLFLNVYFKWASVAYQGGDIIIVCEGKCKAFSAIFSRGKLPAGGTDIQGECHPVQCGTLFHVFVNLA